MFMRTLQRTAWTSLAVSAAALVGLAIAFADKDAVAALIAEGGPVEMATAVLFLVTAVLAAWARFSGRDGGAFAVMLALLAFAAFLDEVGLAAGGLGLDVPTVLGVKLDGLHDILAVLRNALDVLPGPVTLLLPVALGLIGGAGFVLLRALTRRSATIRTMVADPAMPLVLLALGLGFGAQLLDIRYLRLGAAGTVLEEVLELAAAAVLVATGWQLVRRRPAAAITVPQLGKRLKFTHR
jgi:hypothetical protein